ncbi:Ribokinase-like protein [Tricharina praecox]|uniref:Ribokinase-like protein n=1 Tax=Tricharina praecox TaxID=43433 RepID=UPI002220A3C1|nr:Ribokinase-like protein [Tricharina praecox]KAI5846099.1 Ribokinase-like protein [Tricharina praecox]
MSPAILIIGSLNTDLVSTTPRLPALGETLTSSGFSIAPGGKGANQAVACARLSSRSSLDVRMCGAVGTDAFAALLADELAASGVDTELVRAVDGPTGTAVIIVDEASGENRILIHPGANGAVSVRSLVEREKALWDGVELLVLQLEVPVETVVWALMQASRRGVKTVFNPAPALAEGLEGCWGNVGWLVVNETEAAILTGVEVQELDKNEGVVKAADGLKAKGCGAVVVTLGGRGCYWCDGASNSGWQGVTVKREGVVDTTGAGDTFVGALAVALMEGKTTEEAVKWAGRAAGAAVKKRGAMGGVPWRHEVEAIAV